MKIRGIAKVLAAVLALNVVLFTLPDTGLAATNKSMWSQEVIDSAVATDTTSMEVNVSFSWKRTLEVSEAMYMLALMSFYHPDLAATDGTTVSERLVIHIQDLVSGGKEPSCRGGLGGWSDNPVAQALVLAKNTPAVWNELSRNDQKKCDFIMQCMAVVGNFTQNYESHPKTDMSQTSTFEKSWNPNIQEGYVGIMSAVYLYFGGVDQVNEILAGFSYDEYIEKMKDYGFTNVKTYFELTGKDLLENGGTDALGGKVVSARTPFTYQDVKTKEKVEYEPMALFESLASILYSHECISEVYDGDKKAGYIADGSVSPYEGRMGMNYEFKSMDAGGLRTSADYVFKCWRNSVPTRATIEALGYWKGDSVADVETRMYVGTEDFLFKISDEHGGYVGYSKGNDLGAQKESDFANAGQGWKYIKEVWQKYLKRDYTTTVEVNASGGTVSASVEFTNISGNLAQAKLVMMVYDQNGKLTDMETAAVDIGADGAKSTLTGTGERVLVYLISAQGPKLLGSAGME